MYYLQDVHVKSTDILARTFFDSGSNRVLVRDAFAKEAGLVRKKVVWRLVVVGKDEDEAESVEGYMYLAELVDKTGKAWKIWGYRIESIMVAGVPNMRFLQKYFDLPVKMLPPKVLIFSSILLKNIMKEKF